MVGIFSFVSRLVGSIRFSILRTAAQEVLIKLTMVGWSQLSFRLLRIFPDEIENTLFAALPLGTGCRVGLSLPPKPVQF